MYDDLEASLSDIDVAKVEVLDQLAEYLENPDIHLQELIHLQSEHKYLQYEVNEQLEMK